MSKIDFNLLDRDTFTVYRLHRADALAEAYALEAHRDEPRDEVLNTLWEMGQARFSASTNDRSQREALFRQFVAKAYSAYVLPDEVLEALNA